MKPPAEHEEGYLPDELLAAFIDGSLDEDARLRVLDHLAECDECYDLFLAVKETREDAADLLMAELTPRN